MEDSIANVILTELREFRAENEKRWEENDKKWEENNAKWEENDKRWKENNARWEENDQRWEVNNKKWEQNEARWEANNTKWKENDAKLEQVNQRITSLEEDRKKDRKDLLEILDTMQKTINNQFTEMKEYFDAKFEKVFVSQRVNDIEHEEFRKLVCTHEKRLNFYNARLNKIEEWKEQFDRGESKVV